MKTQEIVAVLGSKRATAKLLGISTQAVQKWGTYPPLDKQFQLEVLTKGKLKADRSFANKKE